MTNLYNRMKIYNPDLTTESYQSLIGALKTERDWFLGTCFILVPAAPVIVWRRKE